MPDLIDDLSTDKEALLDLLLKEEGYTSVQTQSITPVDRTDPFPLSFAQQRLWFIDQFEPENPVYNISLAFRLGGQLKRDALNYALNELVCRHESLRTTFTAEMGQPAQIINPAEPVAVPVIDLSHLPENTREVEATRLAKEEAQRPFDLAINPLWRVTLLQLGDNEHLLVFIIHHIIFDEWSITVFIRELIALYTAHATRIPANLPDLPIQYVDFAHWQRQYLQGDALENQLAYWRQKLAGSPPVLDLPTDHHRPPVQTYRGVTQTFTLPTAVEQSLRVLSQREDVTLFMTLLAVFKVLLYRYTNQTDISVGSPMTNRTRVELEGLIGFFVNTLVLRTDLSGQPTFRELLQRVREVALGAYEHQDFPFEMLVDALQHGRDLRYPPLFQVMFALQDATVAPTTMPNLDLSLDPIENDTAKFDLTLEVKPGENGLTCIWEYNTDLFEAATITRMAGHFRVLLESVVAKPNRSIATLPLLTEAERHHMLIEWNGTQTAYPQDQCIHQVFEAQADLTPDAVAVVLAGETEKEGTNSTLTYRELNRRANQLAHYLQSLGVGSETLVGICVERSLEMIVGLLGILKAGGVYVPLDPTYPQERLAFMVEDTQVSILLTQAKQLSNLPPVAQTFCLDADWHTLAIADQENLSSAVTADNLAYVMYTSGSTGRPKGTSILHRGVVRLVKETNYATLTAEEIFLQLAPISFDAATFEIWGALLNGAKLVIMPPHQPSLEELGLAIQQYQVTTLWLTAGLFHLMVDERLDDLKSLKQLLAGGDVLSVPHVRKALQALDGCQLINGYGPTENTTFTCCFPIDDASQMRDSVPIGRPIANTQVYILDHHLQPVPIGVTGELYIGGAGLAREYLNRPELTRERFISNPFNDEPGARLYKTGDLAYYLSNGNIIYLGRIDHQVKLRGFRIELGEIEFVLGQHPAVQGCVVLAREDKPGQKRLVAYVVPQVTEHERQNLPADLRQFLQAILPNYMIPAVFVLLDTLPLTPNGKIDRRALPAPEFVQVEHAEAFIPPTTPAEKILAEIWARVLGLEQVGVHDNFFELGGDSILSIQIIVRAKQAGLHLTSRQLFQHQTIAELASVADVISMERAEQEPVTGLVPLTPIQYWFFEQNLPEPHYWNQSMLLELRQPVDSALLEQVVHHLLIHHDALRLRFERTESGWQQTNTAPDDTVPFSHIDLSSLPEQTQQSALETTRLELQASLNLSQGPMLRVAHFDLDDNKPGYLFIVIHHLVVDGISWRILLEDIQTAYRQLSQHEPIALPPKTTAFKHWSEALTKFAQSESLRQEAAYWLKTVQAKTSPLPLDFSADAGANTAASARTITVRLGADDTSALLQAVPAVYQTHINDALLTALAQTFTHWTGEQTLLIDLEGHGREEIVDNVDLGRTVGWFTTIFPVCLKLTRSSNPGDILKAVKEQLRRVPQRGIGYGLLRYLHHDPVLAEKLQIQPEVAFNYLGQFDQTFVADSYFKPPFEFVGPEHSPLGRRRHLLSINGHITGGQLQVDWTYSQNLHRPATIERLAQDFIEALQALIAHCQYLVVTGDRVDQSIVSPKIEAKQVPPPLALVELPADVHAALPANVEDAYPLAEMQALMLHHQANAPQEAGVYHVQQSLHLQDEAISRRAFREALSIVVKRHPALRTTFITAAEGKLLQVVWKTLPFTVEERDIRDLSPAGQETYIETLMRADRAKPFDLNKSEAPLFRFWILVRSETDFEFLMSIHHAITDGWGHAEFLNELFAVYAALKRGESIDAAPAARVYKEFVALEKEIIASKEARTFWLNSLHSYRHRPLKPRTPSTPTATKGPQTRVLENHLVSRLLSMAQQLKVPLRTIFLSPYLDLIAAETGEQVVTVGLVANGRSERLSDPLRALGLFWYMVPFCHSINPADKISQIKNVQGALLDLDPYVRYPLSRILADQQQAALFFATMNFVHFHNLRDVSITSGLRILGRKERDKFHFPLNTTVSVNPLDRQVELRVEYDERYFGAESITAIINRYLVILEHLAQAARL
jgi:amino acid adenylation domain-containing protein/non-ribosomal peptide synthase protein (TIGR01720 family)